MLNKYLNQYIKELYTRSILLTITFMSCVVIIINFIEFLNNYFLFFSELQINEIEYFYYNNLNYNNTIITYSTYEYDWYLDYNIYFSKFGKTNMLLNTYLYNIFFFMIPYVLYEVYLFISPALYKHEKKAFRSWILYNIFSTVTFIWFTENSLLDFNLLFYWNEDVFIYLNNEVLDLFIDTNERNMISVANIVVHFIFVQYFYDYDYLYDIKIIYTVRYIMCSFILTIFMVIVFNLSWISSIFLTIIYILYAESILIMTYVNTYYQLLKN